MKLENIIFMDQLLSKRKKLVAEKNELCSGSLVENSDLHVMIPLSNRDCDWNYKLEIPYIIVRNLYNEKIDQLNNEIELNYRQIINVN